MSDDRLAVQRAVEEARAQPHRFVFVPPGASPAVVEALRALAAETGREFLQSEAKGATDDFVMRTLSRKRPEVPRDDDGAFIDNLAAIARGTVRVAR